MVRGTVTHALKFVFEGISHFHQGERTAMDNLL